LSIGFQNLHTHTTYCDGSQKPEALVKAAIRKGMGSIGFSEHSYIGFDTYYAMDAYVSDDYITDVLRQREKYKDSIEVFLGIEMDCLSDSVPDGLDFIIGTAHYVEKGGSYISVDVGSVHQNTMVKENFGGDYYSLAEDYFEVMAGIVRKTNADIVGHFDLVAKYNIAGHLFDELHPRYVSAALCAMDEILKDCNLFEVNTGAMYRLGKSEPYPSVFLLKELLMRGGEVILSSDSHDAGSLCFKFSEMHELLRHCGFKYIKRLTKDGFIDVPL